MPCITETPAEEAARTHKELNRVTDMLCWILSRLVSKDWLRADIKAWWNQHQMADEARRRREAEAKQAEIVENERRIAQLQAEVKRLKGS